MNRYVVGMRIPIACDVLPSPSMKETFRGVSGTGLIRGRGEMGITRGLYFKGQEEGGWGRGGRRRRQKMVDEAVAVIAGAIHSLSERYNKVETGATPPQA